jgi:hypothetical protein
MGYSALLPKVIKKELGRQKRHRPAQNRWFLESQRTPSSQLPTYSEGLLDGNYLQFLGMP